MNLLFWKHKKDGHVIKDTCKAKLPSTLQSHYHETEDAPTHYYDDSTSLIAGIIVGEMLADSGSSTPSYDSTPAEDHSGGGGDFGGGGSSDSWGSSDSDSSSYDSGSSSYDSGSSSCDSGSSYDSGGSSY